MTSSSPHPASARTTQHTCAPVRSHSLSILVAGLFLAGFVLVSVCDRSIHQTLAWTLPSRRMHEHELWYRLLRNLGSLWTWLIIGIGLLVSDTIRLRTRSPTPSTPHDPPSPIPHPPHPQSQSQKHAPFWFNRGLFIIFSATAAGLLAEILKRLIGRERPTRIINDELVYQGYRFKGLLQGFVDSSNLGLPSSHAATAAGGVFAICYLWPKAPPIGQLGIWLIGLVAVLGCSLTRILAGAHFASDVYAGMVIGWASAWLLSHLLPGEGLSELQTGAGDLVP